MKGEPGALGVGVIVLHYNRPELAEACLESLKVQLYPLTRLVLVDNGSDDRFGSVIQGLKPAPHILHLAENRGFAGGVNAGIRWLREQGDIDCFWLLNNDAICEPGVLSNMVEMLKSRPELAAVSSTLEERQPDGSLEGITGGRFPLPMLIPFVSRSGDAVDYLCGACMLIRREAIEQVGLLDERYFFFFEDVDWCFRAKRGGWKLGVCAAGGVKHQRSSTIGNHHRLRSAYYRRSYIRFLRQYSKAPVCVAVLTTVYRLMADGLRGRWQSMAGTWAGWKEGWKDAGQP